MTTTNTIDTVLPKWLTKKLDMDDGYYTKITIPLFDHQPLDHFEKRKDPKTGKIEYISQPYGLSYNDLKAMVEICEKHGIEFDIRGDSDHAPGWTIVVKWGKKEEEKEAD